MFRFALVSVERESLGRLAFPRRDFKSGEMIPSGIGRWLRVVEVIEPERGGQLPVLVVELEELRAGRG